MGKGEQTRRRIVAQAAPVFNSAVRSFCRDLAG